MKLKVPSKLSCRVGSAMWIDQQARIDSAERRENDKLQKKRKRQEIQSITM